MVTAPARPATPPGPRGHWLAGNLGEFRRDRLAALSRWAREYGDVVAARFGPRPIWLLSHPDLVEQVLVEHNRRVIKHFALRMTESTLGNGLLTSEGDFWRRQRRLAQPAFHRERVMAHAAMMVEFAERAVRDWRAGEVRDVQDEMMRLTLEIVAKALFDADVSGDAADASAAMETALRCFTRRVARFLPVPEWVPTPMNVRLGRAVRRLNDIIYRIIAARRASGEDRGDLLSMLINATDDGDGPGGEGMTDRQLRDEAMTLFMAGHETTANTLTWVFYHLASNPEAEARLHAEVDAALPSGPPTFADLPRLPYAEHVVNEALRLTPTVWILGREVVEPFEVGGYLAPKGVTLYMSQWVVHRDPRWFDDPLRFRPERWEAGLGRRLHRYAFFPFGGGPRICIGASFAMMESVLILATIARRFRLRPAPDAVVRPLPTMTLRAEGGIRMVIERRD